MKFASMNAMDLYTEQALLSQSCNLKISVKKNLNLDWSEYWSKDIIARLYGFNHWHLLSYHLRRSAYKSDDPRFEYVHLHPKTVENISPNVIDYLNNKKIQLSSIINLELNNSSISLSNDSADILDNILMDIYGFKSINDFLSRLKYHFFDFKVSLFDQDSPHLLINELSPGDYLPVLEELLDLHQDYAPVVAIAPRDYFEADVDYKNISLLNGEEILNPFNGWSYERLSNWIKEKINIEYRNYHEKNLLISLSKIISFLILNKNENLSQDYIINMLEIKNLQLLIKNNFEFRCISSDYFNSLPGPRLNLDNFCFSDISDYSLNYHKRICSLMIKLIKKNKNYFNPVKTQDGSGLILKDIENWQELNQKINKGNMEDSYYSIIRSLCFVPSKSMIFIKISEEDIEDDQIEKIENIAKHKNLLIVWWCQGVPPQSIDKKRYNKLSLDSFDYGGFECHLELLNGKRYIWNR